MDDLDDFGLIDLACEGSARAFEILVRRHYDTMYKFAFRWCGNRSDAEDVTQEACIKLARALGSFEKKSAFSSWLYRLVINTAKDWHRGQARHHVPTGPGATVGEPEPQVASTAGIEEAYFARQVFGGDWNIAHGGKGGGNPGSGRGAVPPAGGRGPGLRRKHRFLAHPRGAAKVETHVRSGTTPWMKTS